MEFTLMYTCGLRVGEAIALPVAAVDSAHMILRVIGKGNKERCVPLPARLLDALRAYWVTHRNRDWLFPACHGRGHMARTSLHRALRLAGEEIGLDPALTCHSLRHGYATRLLEGGADLRMVQVLLGHGSIRSTQIYTHLTEPMRAKLRERVDALFSDLL